MSHQAAAVSSMEDPTKRFREIVGRIKDPGDEGKEYVTVVFPILNRKVLDQNMTRAIRRNASVDHFDGGLVVTVEDCGGGGLKTKVGKYGAKVPSVFGSTHGGIKLSFSRARGRGSLSLTFVSNTTAGKNKNEASGRASLAEVIGVGGVKETGEHGTRGKDGKGWRTRNRRQEWRGARRETGIKCRATEVDTPSACGAKILSNFLEHCKVEVAGSRRELA